MIRPATFRCFKTSPGIIRLAVIMHVRYPLPLQNVGDLLHERGIDITHETVRFWWNHYGMIFAAEIRRSRVQAMRHVQHRQWHLDEVFVKIKGVKHTLLRAVDHEGQVLNLGCIGCFREGFQSRPGGGSFTMTGVPSGRVPVHGVASDH